MKRLLKYLAFTIAGLAVLLITVSTYFVVRAHGREPLEVVPGTVHTVLSRESCTECHAPIAAEWRESFHFRSVAGPFWERIRRKGFAGLFEKLRVPCMNCHAPATVLDLPAGAYPQERSDAPELGVDCVSCHVSKGRIVGGAEHRAAGSTPHETVGDERFRDPVLASTAICAKCHNEPLEHARTVEVWQRTELARQGLTCLHCHMPFVEAPVVAGGAARVRRSHRFPGDKDIEMLRTALNAAIDVATPGKAVVSIVNDRVGHSFPAAGTNSLIVRVTVRNETGTVVEEVERDFGTREWIPGYLDFWPFVRVTKIPAGEERAIAVRVPSGHGTISAEFRYRDWFAITDSDLVFARIVETY